MKLQELGVGQRAKVVEVEGSDAISVRLLEMGITPGTPVEYIGKAPLGDPLEFQIRGYRLSLRKSEASRVVIALLDPTPA